MSPCPQPPVYIGSDLGLSVMSAMDPVMMDGTDRDRKTQAKYTLGYLVNQQEMKILVLMILILFSSIKFKSGIRENTQRLKVCG